MFTTSPPRSAKAGWGRCTAFPSGQGRWPVGRGQFPHWSETGDRLYFMGGNGIHAVDVTTTPGLSLSEPRTALTAPGVEFQHGWGMSADGSRFLVNRSASLDTGASVTVVQNWFAEFAANRQPQR